MERFPPMRPEDMDAAQHKMSDHYRAGWRGKLVQADGRLGGPLDTMLRAPELASRISHLSDYFRTEVSLPQRLNEMAIIMTAASNRSHYEWAVHRPWAEREGLPAAIGDALMAGRRPSNMAPDEEVVYDLVSELERDKEVSDATFARARKLLTDQQIIEVVTVSGLYTTVARILAIAQIPAPGDNPAPLGRRST